MVKLCDLKLYIITKIKELYMFGDYLMLDNVSKQAAKRIFKQLDKKLLLKPLLISIGGISGTRKSETAFRLAEILINNGKQCHIISGDDYYIIPWHIRNDIRKSQKNLIVGPTEYDWNRLNWTFETWKNPLYTNIHFFMMSKFSTDVIQGYISKKNCNVLIFEGLYGCHTNIPANIKIHIGKNDPESTYKFRSKRKKENEENEFRKRVVELECKAVKKLQDNANLVV